MPTIGLYAGSFDPITRGHEDLIRRSLTFVDRLVVAVATNLAKQPLFTIDERMQFIRQSLHDETRVEVMEFEGLLVDFARQVQATVSVRGLRAVGDFEYEFQMALMNRHLHDGLETLFMVPSPELGFVSSSLVREVARYGGSIAGLVHPVVETALRGKALPK
jgi:pantetheine-phosphate adenylyltransferase